MIFYLGAGTPYWLWRHADRIPLFVSDTQLRKLKNLKPTGKVWALDSGGYSEIHKYGKWTQTPQDYAKRCRRYVDEIGKLQFCAIQDWMCEDSSLAATGKSVLQHQINTLVSYGTLSDIDSSLPWLPVLQGRDGTDYIKHAEMYLNNYPHLKYFGLGSVCRRAKSQEIVKVVEILTKEFSFELHGFGVKTKALEKIGHMLKSADSMAWSFRTIFKKTTFLPTCTHKKCNHCYPWAKNWYRQQIKKV